MPDANVDPKRGVTAFFHLVEKAGPDGKVLTEPYLRITHAGDKHYMRDQKVTDADITRWPDEYARFKAGVVDQSGGTPLKEMSDLTLAQINGLVACNIYTVEMLSNVTDGNLAGIGMGGQTLRAKARAWLEARKTQLSPEQMMAQIAELRARLDAEPERRGPGRPRKEQEAA